MYKLMIVLLLAAVAGLFFIPGPGGEPFLTLESFRPDMTLPNVSGLFGEGSEEGQSQVMRVYKWQDENGVWQFSNRAEDADGAEVIELDGVVNTLAPLEVVKRNSASAAAQTRTSSMPALTTVPLSQAMDTVDKARQMQETVDSRKADLDKALESN